jgi:hypothetical protein
MSVCMKFFYVSVYVFLRVGMPVSCELVCQFLASWYASFLRVGLPVFLDLFYFRVSAFCLNCCVDFIFWRKLREGASIFFNICRILLR